MRLGRPIRAQQSETIIALIDVVFFLLVFFMLIGRMDATAPFEVAPPMATTGADMPAGGVTLAISADGALAFEGAATDAAGFEQALMSRLAANADLRLRVNAHHDAELRNVLPLVARAEALGAGDIVLVVTPEAKQ